MKRKVITAICIGAVLAVSGCIDSADTAEDTTAAAGTAEEQASESDTDSETVFSSETMPLLTFLEENDLSGKQVYLFCSHGTGGLANSVEIITEAAPDAVISDDIFDCYEEEAASSQEEIQNWTAGIGE